MGGENCFRPYFPGNSIARVYPSNPIYHTIYLVYTMNTVARRTISSARQFSSTALRSQEVVGTVGTVPVRRPGGFR